jgi:peptidyl-prolyl cis-trans isomerase D
MLQDIREKSLGTFGKVIIGVIIAVFALFGVESIIGGFTQPPSVADVNGEEITQFELDQSVQNLLASVGGNLNGIDQGFLESIALNQIIEEAILRQKANSEGMTISSDRIDRGILETESFQINGAFDPDLAVRTMATQGLNVALYRESLAQRMVLSQLANAFTSTSFITENELERFVRLSAQTRDFRYISVTMGTRTLGTAVKDDEIFSYYDSNENQFTEEESVVVQYVLLDKNSISNELVVADADLLASYESERSEFEGSSEKRASHILFEISGELDQSEALRLAETAKTRIEEGEEFASMALELSSDQVSAEVGGDIGYTDGTAFPDAIETALEGLGIGEVSVPVISEFGVHLLKLTEDSENTFPSFEESRERIERDLKSSEVEQIYAERLQDLSNLAFETGDLDTISEELDLTVLESDSIQRGGGVGIFSNETLVEASYSDEVFLDGNNSEVIELDDSQSLVLRVLEYNEAMVLPLDDVQPEIAVILRTQMERDAVQKIGSSLVEQFQEGADLEVLLMENDLSWVVETDVERSSFSVNREILEEVFSLSAASANAQSATLTLDNGTFVLVELNAVNEGALESIPEDQRLALAESIVTDIGNNDFQGYMGSLRDNSDIQTNLLDEVF